MEYTIHLTRVYRGKTIHTTKLCCEARKHSLNCNNITHTGVAECSRTIEHMRGRYETMKTQQHQCWRRRITRNGPRITTPGHRVLILGRGTPNRASRLILIVVYVRLSCVLVSRVAASLLLYSDYSLLHLRLFPVMTSISSIYTPQPLFF